MDEYLFIAVAKLKADRLRLEREERLAAQSSQPRDEEPTESHRASARRKWFSSHPEWREQS